MGLDIRFLKKDKTLIKEVKVDFTKIYNKILRQKRSILDIALDNKVDLKYGCMGGSCSACICVVTKGAEFLDREGLHKIVYKKVSQKQILTCITTIKDEVRDLEKDAVIEIVLLL